MRPYKRYGIVFLVAALLGLTLYATQARITPGNTNADTDSGSSIGHPLPPPPSPSTAPPLTAAQTAAAQKQQAIAEKRADAEAAAEAVNQLKGAMVQQSTALLPSGSAAQGDNTEMAYIACQEFVGRKLTSPETAKWPSIYEVNSTQVAPHKYRVTGSVESENSFGGNIRSDFVAIMRNEGGTWLCSKVTVGTPEP